MNPLVGYLSISGALLITIILMIIVFYSSRMIYSAITLFLWKMSTRRVDKANQIQKEKELLDAQLIWEKREEERFKKIAELEQKGLERVVGMPSGDYFIEIEKPRDNIKAMYDIDGCKVSLANLARSKAAKIIGISPSIYYGKYKVSKEEILRDEHLVKT